MNTFRISVCSLGLMVALAAGCTTPAGGSWPRKGVVSPRSANPPASKAPAADLELQLATERRTYLVGEPVYLMLRLTNTGAQPQRVVGSLNPIDGAVEIMVRPADGRPIHFVPLVEADHDEGILIDLPPQGSLGGVVPLFFGANGWTFTSPGKYELTAVYHTPSRENETFETRSPALTLEIERTADGAGEFLIGRGERTSYEAGKFLTWQSGDHLQSGRDHLQLLLQRWPESPLVHYVHSAFAQSYGKRFADYRTRRVRPPDCERALDHLERVADEFLPEYIRFQNSMTRIRCAVRAQDREAAQAGLQQADQIVGDLPEYRDLRIQLEELEKIVNETARDQN